MAYKIKRSPRAASNFEDICNYIGKDSKYYASLFAKKVNALIKAIPQFPKAGRIVPEYGNENIREKSTKIIELSIVVKKLSLKLLPFVMVQNY